MANIILPAVPVLEEIDQHTTLLIEQAGEINRYPISDLDIGGGDVTIDLSSADSIADSGNFINADTLGGRPANNYLLKNELILDDNTIVINKADIIESASGEVISINDSASVPIQSLKLYGKTTQNGTPTPDAPVPLVSAGDGGSIGITVAGKNLMNLPQSVYKFDNAWHWDLFAGTVGVETAVPADKLELLPILKAGIDYSFSYTIAEGAIGAACNLQKVNEDGTTSWGNIISFGPGTVRVAQDTRVTVRAELNGYYTIENIQLEIGSTVTAYEPYSAQIITVSTPNGLPGIPVTSGGNYTDETGQQWVCDEVDFARGVYVQRVLSEVFDNADGWSMVGTENGRKIFFLNRYVEVLKKASAGDVTANLLCSNFQNKTPDQIWAGEQGICVDGGGFIQISYGEIEQTLVALGAYLTNNPVTFMAELATPVETPLSAEELAAYTALHTNYPNTTILNDGGAGMEVEYGVDTKLYIDKLVKSILPIYVPQELTEAQKTQARANIGAATVNDVLAALPTWTGGTY